MSVRIGVINPPWIAPELMPSNALMLEDLGIEEMWLWEDCFFESGLGAAAGALGRTNTLKVNVGLMPAPLRNVALTAMEVATVDRMFPGRFQHVVGHGVQSWMGQTGARVESPLQLLREYIVALDLLLSGANTSVSGRYVNLDGVQLTYPPLTSLRTWGGATGEKTLELLGEVASGVLVDGGTSPERLREIIDLIDRGCATGGRSVRPEVPVYVYLFRGPEAARRYEEVFGPMPSNPEQARGLLGSAEMIAESIGRFVASGATSVVLRPHESDSDLPGFASLVARDVLPALRNSLS